MDINDIKNKIFSSNYIVLAVREYFKFKNDKAYDEKYKSAILGELNLKIHEMRITPENVMELVKMLNQNNPTKGSFVHWSDLSDLKEYTEKNPVESAQSFNDLYNDSLNLKKRINDFLKNGKGFNSRIGFGTPMFGYLLSAYDMHKYPLYKDGIFTDFLNILEVSGSIQDIPDKYCLYVDICSIIIEYFKGKGYLTNPDMMDAQDFIFCISQYPDFYMPVNIRYLSDISIKLRNFKENTEDFIGYINSMDQDVAERIYARYKDDEKINKIRALVAKERFDGRNINRQILGNIKREVNSQHKENILKVFDDFRILFPLYYEQYKGIVRVILKNIRLTIQGLDAYSEVKFKKDKYICDFWGPNSFGDTHCWLAAYPDDKESHRKATQLFFMVNGMKIEYGLYNGDQWFNPSTKDTEVVDLDSFSYSKLAGKFESVKEQFVKLNNEVVDNTSVKYWMYNIVPQKQEVWEKCKTYSCAAVSYISNIDFNTKQNIDVMKGIKPKDKVVAYAPPSRICAVGEVISPYYEEEDADKLIYNLNDMDTSDDKRSYSQRIGVNWTKVMDVPIKVEQFDKAIEQVNSTAKASHAFSEITEKGFSEAERIIDDNILETGIDFEVDFKIQKLIFENRELIEKQIRTALKSGKNIILTGPPGTGKSKLAKEICEHYKAEYMMVTASSDWSNYETIGGYMPDISGQLHFTPGIFLKCFKSNNGTDINKWLIIDEINRADIDKAFGSMFSALTGDKVTLNYKDGSGNNIEIVPKYLEEDQDGSKFSYKYIVPKDFRIIGTMNTFDKASLYEMSYAFMRRFAFIFIPVPRSIDENMVDDLIKIWGIEDKNPNNIKLSEGIKTIWQIINQYRKIGPAIVEDIARFISDGGDYTSAILMYALPQFEGLSEDRVNQFVQNILDSNLRGLIDKDNLQEFVSDFLNMA
jgi:AAA domain (dynein-related subfamily).